MTKFQIFRGPAPGQSVCSLRRSSRSITTLATSRSADQQPHTPLPIFLSNVATQSAAVLLAGLVVASPGPALAADAATDANINPLRSALKGAAQFYRSRQQANGGALLLGPIQLSRQRLETAAAALENTSQEFSSALDAVRAASLDCVVFGDIATSGKQDLTTAFSANQEYKLGDPCKLRLVVKNATTLTKDENLVADTEAKMQQIIR